MPKLETLVGWRGRLLVAVVYAAARCWVVADVSPRVWPDTLDYRRLAHASLFSLDFWAGKRAPFMPFVYKLVGTNDQVFMWLQVGISIASWLFLAAVVMHFVQSSRQLFVGALVLLFSLATPLVLWDGSVLSESLAISSLVCLVAVGLLMIERVTWPRAVGTIVAIGVFVTVRDTDLIVSAIIGATIVIIAVLAKLRHWRPVPAAVVTVGIAALLVSGVTSVAEYAKRDRGPTNDVFASRVLPYADRVDWFASHGMPDADALRALVTRPGHPVDLHGPIASSSATKEYRAWLDSHQASRAYRLWLVTHPIYLLTEPFSGRGEIQTLGYYLPKGLHEVIGPVSNVLYPTPMWVVAIWGLLMLAVVWRRGSWRSPVVIMGVVLAVLAIPHALAAWHGDAQEVWRHVFLAGFQGRLGVVLLTCAAIGAVPSIARDHRGGADEVGAAADATTENR